MSNTHTFAHSFSLSLSFRSPSPSSGCSGSTALLAQNGITLIIKLVSHSGKLVWLRSYARMKTGFWMYHAKLLQMHAAGKHRLLFIRENYVYI